MNSNNHIVELLAPYGPRLPLDKLAEEVNKLYHAAEAPLYDKRHPEIMAQLPAIWEEMAAEVLGNEPRSEWHILDYGCGTGFASLQALRLLPTQTVKSLTCYDPSVAMLKRCREKVGNDRVTYLSNRSELFSRKEQYNLLLTNSLLHHLADPVQSVIELAELLMPRAVWMAGHEPSKRFYQNPECLNLLSAFNRYNQVFKYFDFRNYVEKFNQVMRPEMSPVAYAARMAHAKGLFDRKPTPFAIGRLVDFHVAHSWEEAVSGRGFDIDALELGLRGQWKLAWHKSYSFMGHYSECRISEKWTALAQSLAARHPKDGANFCSVWHREQ